MPIIRGECIRVGQDIWWVEGVNVKVGIAKIIKEAEQTILVETNEGDRIINPKDVLIFASPTEKSI